MCVRSDPATFPTPANWLRRETGACPARFAGLPARLASRRRTLDTAGHPRHRQRRSPNPVGILCPGSLNELDQLLAAHYGFTDENGRPMKQARKKTDDPEMRKEYNFSRGIRG